MTETRLSVHVYIIFIMKSYSEYKQTTKEKEKKHTHNLSSRNTLNETSHIRCKKLELLNVKQPSRMNTNSSNICALLSSSESVGLHKRKKINTKGNVKQFSSVFKYTLQV